MAKIGLEIEGKRHYGKRTLFLASWEINENANHKTILNIAESELVEQIYISDHHNEVEHSWLKSFFGLVSDTVAITVEVKQLPKVMVKGVGIMLCIQDGTSIEEIDELGDTDEVKVSNGLNVWSWSKADAVRTYPQQFEKDVNIYL